MSKITLQGNPINTIGNLPAIGSIAPDFMLVKSDLMEITLSQYKGKKIILNIFPSIDTPICAMSTRKFNSEINNLKNTVVFCISMDLPFAHGRFCGAEGLSNVITLSAFRNPDFGKNYGAIIIDGPLKGLLSRAIVVINEQGKILYTEQVAEIAKEPNYQKAIEVVK